MRIKRLLPVAVLVAAVLACNAPTTPGPSTTPTLPPETVAPLETPLPPTEAPPTEPPAGPTPTPPANVRGPGFAAYPKIEVALPTAYKGDPLAVDLATLGNYSRFTFSAAQSAMLAENGFVVVPAEWLEFFQLYESVRYEEIPVFVTTDSVYHVYHLLFDKMLRDLEREHFHRDILDLTVACQEAASALYAELAGTELDEAALRVLAYFAVPNVLMNPDAVTPPEVAAMVAAELEMIDAHAGPGVSAIFRQDPPEDRYVEDYSQYVPRGHYTRSELLERYFRAMMWYGRINMRLEKPYETRMALLIAHILRNTTVNGQPAVDVWSRVYDPTVFIVGKSDDLSFYEYGALWDSVFGPAAPVSTIADEGKLAAFTDAARLLPPPQINSMWVYIWEDEEQVTQGFRFMGQRFVLDAYIFEQLIWREVGTIDNPRMLPKGLDVMAAMGSEEAYTILDQMGETGYANYPEQMAKLRGEISALQLDSWTQNLYWTWLYALHPLLEAKGPQYPGFMRTEAWVRKDLQTALGSWTELKHDTILYAKQVMAELGGGPPPEPPHGWVEPNPQAYARLLALARMTREGLGQRGLLTENTDVNLWRLEDVLAFLLDVSERELAGAPLTNEDYERIKYYGGELEAMTLAAADQQEGEGQPFFEEDKEAAVVADVATDPQGWVLEEATGRIFEIYVAVPDGRGGVHLAQGGVFSYYEFPWPIGDRLTDEAWRGMLANGQAPEQPEWTGTFTAE